MGIAKVTYPYLFSNSLTLLTVRVGLSVMQSLYVSSALGIQTALTSDSHWREGILGEERAGRSKSSEIDIHYQRSFPSSCNCLIHHRHARSIRSSSCLMISYIFSPSINQHLVSSFDCRPHGDVSGVLDNERRKDEGD